MATTVIGRDGADFDLRFSSMLRRSWWLLLLRGLAAIAFGVLTWLQPALSLVVLVLLFGIYSMADGILCFFTAVLGRRGSGSRWVLTLEGLLGIGVGLVTFVWPGFTALALLVCIALWAIATGVLEIVAAIRLRKEIQGEWVLIVAGIVSIAFGILLLARPGAGILALVWLIAAYALSFGMLFVVLAFKARRFAHVLPPSRRSPDVLRANP